jgi:hypothetical protein
MPYIHPDSRPMLSITLGDYERASDPGGLNYQFTQLCNEYIKYNGNKGEPSYRLLNDIVGALEACKLEFYRRAVAPYEDKKIIENGDVYE